MTRNGKQWSLEAIKWTLCAVYAVLIVSAALILGGN